MNKTLINTVIFRHGLTRINTDFNFTSVVSVSSAANIFYPLCGFLFQKFFCVLMLSVIFLFGCQENSSLNNAVPDLLKYIKELPPPGSIYLDKSDKIFLTDLWKIAVREDQKVDKYRIKGKYDKAEKARKSREEMLKLRKKYLENVIKMRAGKNLGSDELSKYYKDLESSAR